MGGYDKHQQRQEALNELGRALARRAKSRCELCQEGGVKLMAYEVPPAPADPELERTLLLCQPCLDGLARPKQIEGQRWRFLETSIWSESVPVKVCSVVLLRALGQRGQQWALDCEQSAYLEPEAQAWLDEQEG